MKKKKTEARDDSPLVASIPAGTLLALTVEELSGVASAVASGEVTDAVYAQWVRLRGNVRQLGEQLGFAAAERKHMQETFARITCSNCNKRIWNDDGTLATELYARVVTRKKTFPVPAGGDTIVGISERPGGCSIECIDALIAAGTIQST